jgi:uncharacterized membrane protein
MGISIVWLIVVLFVLTGIVLLTGHGWQVIAGYNTASKEEKAKYDLDRLYLVNGVGLIVMGLLMGFMNYFADNWPLIVELLFLLLLIIVIVVIVVMSGTWCMKDNPVNKASDSCH